MIQYISKFSLGHYNRNVPSIQKSLPTTLACTLKLSLKTKKVCLEARFESMSFIVNILACKLKIVNNRN